MSDSQNEVHADLLIVGKEEKVALKNMGNEAFKTMDEYFQRKKLLREEAKATVPNKPPRKRLLWMNILA
ncbi:hypothetical protein IEQ34_001792 [Dendrobium chrysotoxum]|uniref:Uncharacterized protein n=1 Tax=Dendrobium chrysotoxum TaxID=161865 RepID=A0AAV7H8X0_DENCH|nr:hypothetical protein IEQ34_001792 [Dendrobium chrysotoxum]